MDPVVSLGGLLERVVVLTEPLLASPLLGGSIVVALILCYLLLRAFTKPGYALPVLLLVLGGGALAYLLVVEPLTERFDAARGGALRTAPFPELTRTVFLLPSLRERAREARTGIAHLFTDQAQTFVYSLDPISERTIADLLIIVGWQERVVGPAENPTRAVRQQLAQTEAAIIRRVEAARAVGRPILVIGTTVPGVTEEPQTALFRARHPLGLQLTPALRAALTDYHDAHYLLAQSSAILTPDGENGATRRDILAFLSERQIETVRLTGAPEQLLVRHAASALLLEPGSGRTHTVLVSPLELADTDAVLTPEREPDVVYRSLPVYALTGALRHGQREVYLGVQSPGALTPLGSLTTRDALDHF